MTRRIFVTGTDTDVGKTVVSRAIVRCAVRRGLKVAAVKPVESGAPVFAGESRPVDARDLWVASRQESAEGPLCAYSFIDPVSPHLAAAREGVTIGMDAILQFIRARENGADLVIAEGAGGLLVPLSDHLLYADVIARTGYSLVVVAPNVLGAINATLLTLEAARSRSIPLLGVILNRTPGQDLGNAAAIAAHGSTRVLGTLPTADELDDENLADLAETHLDIDHILNG